MDLVGYDKEIFYEVCRNFEFIGPSDMFKSIYFIPISALKGDNVVERSENMDWFKGISLLNWLEEIEIKKFNKNQKARFSVQYVVHSEGKNFITGRVASGFFQKGESIKILPSGEISTIQSIETFNGQKEIAYFNNSVSLVIGNNINIERGNLIVKQNELPYANNEIELMVCWFNEKPLLKTKKYIVKHATAESEIEITDIIYKVNISKLENESDVKEVKMNDIAKVKIKTKNQIYFDAYNDNRITGSLIFIDPETNETVGAGMILKSQEELSQIINEVQI
jgi:sulfate adenylyltransferase subunit 1